MPEGWERAWAAVAEGAVPTEAIGSVAGHGGDDAARGYFADAVVVGIGDIEISGGIAGYAERKPEGGGGCLAAIPTKPAVPSPAMVLMMPAGETLRMR